MGCNPSRSVEPIPKRCCRAGRVASGREGRVGPGGSRREGTSRRAGSSRRATLAVSGWEPRLVVGSFPQDCEVPIPKSGLGGASVDVRDRTLIGAHSGWVSRTRMGCNPSRRVEPFPKPRCRAGRVASGGKVGSGREGMSPRATLAVSGWEPRLVWGMFPQDCEVPIARRMRGGCGADAGRMRGVSAGATEGGATQGRRRSARTTRAPRDGEISNPRGSEDARRGAYAVVRVTRSASPARAAFASASAARSAGEPSSLDAST